MAKIDLHMHSYYSCDGEYYPEQLVEKAAQANLKAIAIADHNTTEGVLAGIEAGRKAGIEVIPAVELDCFYSGVLFHVLGYGIDPTSHDFTKLDEHIKDMERNSAKERIRKINEAGIMLDEDEGLAHAKFGCFMTGEIMAEIVLNKPDASKNILLRPFLPGGARSDNPYVNFFWDFCGQGRPAYVHIPYMSMKEAIDLIYKNGGVPVLAHPGNNLKGHQEFIPDIIRTGVCGLEVYSSYHTSEDINYYKQLAETHSLLITMGSDFHGKTKPAIFMGEFGLSSDGLAEYEALKEACECKKI